MNITEKFLNELLRYDSKDKLNSEKEKDNEKQKNIINIENLVLNKIVLHEKQFEYLEYLTLRNTQLKDISFISFIPNLWYLDLRNNFVILN